MSEDEGFTEEMIRKLLADALKRQRVTLTPVQKTLIAVSQFTGYSVQELKEMPPERFEKYVDTIIRGAQCQLKNNPGSTLN
jgi:hypothetical protein